MKSNECDVDQGPQNSHGAEKKRVKETLVTMLVPGGGCMIKTFLLLISGCGVVVGENVGRKTPQVRM